MSKTTIVMPVDRDDDFVDLATRLWLAQEGEPLMIVVDTWGNLEHNPGLMSRLRNHPRVEVACLNLRPPAIHYADPVAYATGYAFNRCETPYLLSTHVDVFPLHRGVVKFMQDQMPDAPVVGWGMSPRGPEAERCAKAGIPYEGENEYADGVMGMVCTMYDVPRLDPEGVSWCVRRGASQFGIPRSYGQVWAWPDVETTFAKICQDQGIDQKFLGRETNMENQRTEHWLHARSARVNREPRHWESLKEAAALAAAWGV